MALEGLFQTQKQIDGIGLWQGFVRHWTNSADFSIIKLCVLVICPAVIESLLGISGAPISAGSQAPILKGCF